MYRGHQPQLILWKIEIRVPRRAAGSYAARVSAIPTVSGRKRTKLTPLLLVGSLGACLVGVGLLTLSSKEYEVAGLRCTDAWAAYGLPATRIIADIAAVVCVGALLFAAFLVPAEQSGRLSPPARRAIRTASRAAALWAASGWQTGKTHVWASGVHSVADT